MAEQAVTVGGCGCLACEGFRSKLEEKGQGEFSFQKVKFEYGFGPIVNPKGALKISEEVFDNMFNDKLKEDVKKRNVRQLVEMLTYLSPEVEQELLELKMFIGICDYLHGYDLGSVIDDKRLAGDFLLKISRYFVIAWHSMELEEGDKQTGEWTARQLRRFLTQMLTYQIISEQVVPVFYSKEKWPKVGPLHVIETMCRTSLVCKETLSLLVNLTRIEQFCGRLEETECVTIAKERFAKCCNHIQNYDDYGQLLLLLYTNLTSVEDFLKFLIEANHGYFMNIVLVDLISRSDSCIPPLNVVWPFFRNLSLLEKGREMIIENLELYLGHVLYPIAGPEKLTADESANLPLEVADLHETKTRIEDNSIKECILDILYSLCRYKKDRALLRDADVYQILKHFHLAEEDTKLQEKIEDLVNILIRKEGSEIEVNDLMEGLSVQPAQQKSLPSSTS